MSATIHSMLNNAFDGFSSRVVSESSNAKDHRASLSTSAANGDRLSLSVEATGRSNVSSLAQAHYVPNDNGFAKVDGLINAIKGAVKSFVSGDMEGALGDVQKMMSMFKNSDLSSLDVSLSMRRGGETAESGELLMRPSEGKAENAKAESSPQAITRIPRAVSQAETPATPVNFPAPAATKTAPKVAESSNDDAQPESKPAAAAAEQKPSAAGEDGDTLSNDLRALFEHVVSISREMGLRGSRLEQLLPNLLDIAVEELKSDPELAGNEALLQRIADEFDAQFQPSAAADAYASTVEFEFSLELSLTA